MEIYRTRTLGVAAVIAGVVLMGSCGDDDAGDAATSTEIEATAGEFQFEPDDWSVPAGQEFTIDFTNDGAVEHEWAVIKLGDDLEAEADFAEEKVLLEVEKIAAGTSTTESFTIEEAGTYQVICALEGHFEAGMEGTLTVG